MTAATRKGGPLDLITPEGVEKLRAEAEQLWKVERPQVTRDVSWAAELGDRSENADYIYGKRRLREIDRRLRFLGKRLDALTVVRPRPAADGKVTFGAWVTLEQEPDDDDDDAAAKPRRHCYRLVGPDEFDVERGWISIGSPMGRALLGKREGDEFEVNRPRGAAWFTVIAIAYEDPAATTT